MKTKIDEELIGAFLEGNTTAEESATILRKATEDKGLWSLLDRTMTMDNRNTGDYQLFEPSDGCISYDICDEEIDFGAFQAMAAETYDLGNLCEVVCEQMVMGMFGIDRSLEELARRAEEREWLNDEGVPIENMGCLMESEGMKVKRSFHNGIAELKKSVAERWGVIVMVDAAEMWGRCNDHVMGYTPNHAVVVREVSDSDVAFFDPKCDMEMRLDYREFLEAWNDSSGYMVKGNKKG